MKDIIKGTFLILLSIVCTLAVISVIITALPGIASPAKSAAGVAQALATVAAVVLGALFAYRNSLLFRTGALERSTYISR